MLLRHTHSCKGDAKPWDAIFQSPEFDTPHACPQVSSRGTPGCISDTGSVPCRPAFDEAAAASYELGDAEYAANEVEVTWVTSLLGILVACLQWLQPMLTPGNFDALVASLLDKARLLLLRYWLPACSWPACSVGR